MSKKKVGTFFKKMLNVASNSTQLAKLVMITGASRGGLGYEAARQVLEQGHSVILSFRDASKAKDAIDSLIREGADVDRVDWVDLDLMSLASVREAAKDIGRKHSSIDVLMVRTSAAHASRLVNIQLQLLLKTL